MPTLDTPANFLACIIFVIAGSYPWRCSVIINNDSTNKNK